MLAVTLGKIWLWLCRVLYYPITSSTEESRTSPTMLRQRRKSPATTDTTKRKRNMGRTRTSDPKYESPTERRHANLYAKSYWRWCVGFLITSGAAGKFVFSSSSPLSLLSSPSAIASNIDLIDLPFIFVSIFAGISLVYWLILPYPARRIWPDPRLPCEEAVFVRYQYQIAWPTRCLGLFVLACGVVGMLSSSFALGSSWSALAKPVWTLTQEGWISSVGPYAYVRHPMYACNCWIALGLGLVSSNLTVFLSWSSLAISLLLRIPSEEEEMRKRCSSSSEEILFDSWMNQTNALLPKMW